MPKNDNKTTFSDWKKMVANNCKSSYGLAVALAVLMLWESGVEDESTANEKLMEFELHLSGAQAGMAVSLALSNAPTDWLDETMVKVMRSR